MKIRAPFWIHYVDEPRFGARYHFVDAWGVVRTLFLNDERPPRVIGKKFRWGYRTVAALTITRGGAKVKKKEILAEPLGRCPCGGEIHASLDPPSVVHSIPYCAKFLQLEPDEFLTYVRRSRGIPDDRN